MIISTIQYLIILILIPICDLFIRFDIPSKSNVFRYNGNKLSSLSFRSTNPYYAFNNLNSSSLIDYMRTLYEQEKRNDMEFDYNLIRALAPRIGKRVFYDINVCHLRLKLK